MQKESLTGGPLRRKRNAIRPIIRPIIMHGGFKKYLIAKPCVICLTTQHCKTKCIKVVFTVWYRFFWNEKYNIAWLYKGRESLF